MLELKDILKKLTEEGILDASMHYHLGYNKFYIDLNTRAKSELWLLENGLLVGRYEYKVNIDMYQDMDELIRELCYEFKNACHGKGFGDGPWAKLCKEKKINLA